MSVQAKAAIWYAICNFFQKGIAFIVVPIYARILTTAEYGKWSVFQSWAAILIIFASLNLYCGVYTKALVDIPEKKERDRYTSCMQGLGTLITIVWFVLYFFTRNWVNKVLDLDTPLVVLLFVYFLAFPAFSFWSTRQRVEYKYRSMVAVTVVMTVLTPVVSIILLYTTELRERALIIGFLLVQCVVGLIFYVLQFIQGKCFFVWKNWKHATKFNIPLIPHYLSLIILNQADRIMIKDLCGESDAGIYSFAYQIAAAVNALISAVNGARVPWTYERLKDRVFDRLRSVTTSLVLMMSGIVLMISLFSPEVILLLGTEKYSVAVYVIPVVTVGVYYTFVYDLYASIEFYFGATRYVMYASVLGASLNLVLNFFYIQKYGFIAAAYTTLICYMVFMIMHFVFSKMVLKEQKITERVYNNGVIFAITGATTAVCLLSLFTVAYPVIRYSIIGIMLVVCIIMRKKIKAVLAAIKK